MVSLKCLLSLSIPSLVAFLYTSSFPSLTSLMLVDPNLIRYGNKRINPSTSGSQTQEHLQVFPLPEMSTPGNRNPPHVALLPSTGMGHLIPFLRLATTLASHGCELTFLSIQPTVSAAETLHLSRLFSSFPLIHPLEFRPLPLPADAAIDPFHLQYETINRSAHLLKSLLAPLLSSSSPISVLITDVALTSAIKPIANELSLPNYIYFTSSATALATFTYFSVVATVDFTADEEFRIPGLPPLPTSSLPPALRDPNHPLTAWMMKHGQALTELAGILVNTFDSFEPEALSALASGSVVESLPAVFPVGPLEPHEAFETGDGRVVDWLDEQPAGSVVYVSFGSRTALSREQIKELGLGLERSGLRFIWVVKFKVVDKEDKEEEEIVDDGFAERVKNRGLIVRGWVDQWKILGHRGVGGFVSHCGWNSISEAAWYGVPVLAWPQGGDQKINAGIVERSGLGIWMKEWGWGGEKVVKADEIEARVKELMCLAQVKTGSTRVREDARRAARVGGCSYEGLRDVMARQKRE